MKKSKPKRQNLITCSVCGKKVARNGCKKCCNCSKYCCKKCRESEDVQKYEMPYGSWIEGEGDSDGGFRRWICFVDESGRNRRILYDDAFQTYYHCHNCCDKKVHIEWIPKKPKAKL